MSADLLAELREDFERVTERHITVLIQGLQDLEQHYSRYKVSGKMKAASEVMEEILNTQQRAFKTLGSDLNIFCRFLDPFYKLFEQHPEVIEYCRRWTVTLLIDQCHNPKPQKEGLLVGLGLVLATN